MYSECYEIDWIEAHEKWEADRAAQEQAVLEATELDAAIARSKRLAREWGSNTGNLKGVCDQCEFFKAGQCGLWNRPANHSDLICALAVCVYPF